MPNTAFLRHNICMWGIKLAIAATLAGAPTSALASPSVTPAAARVDNVADVAFRHAGTAASITSNRASFQVQEILDVRVDVLTPELTVEPDQSDQPLGFLISNLGNGFEAFDLSIITVDLGFAPQDCGIIVDGDGDGVLDRARDPLSSKTPILAPGASIRAWVSCRIPASASQGAIARIVMKAFPVVLRDGVTEGLMAKAGNGGVYVVIGSTLREGSDGAGGTSPPAFYSVEKVNAQLVKSQTVLDLAGGMLARPRSIVTYSLEVSIGSGPIARQATITDAIPAGTSYIDGSLTLDGAALSDAADEDRGRFTGDGIEVRLGDLAPQAHHLVTFKVLIGPVAS